MALVGGVAPMVSIELAASAGGLVYLNNDADAVRSLAFIQWQPAPPAAAGQPPRMATTQGILGLALLPAAHPDQSPAGDPLRIEEQDVARPTIHTEREGSVSYIGSRARSFIPDT